MADAGVPATATDSVAAASYHSPVDVQTPTSRDLPSDVGFDYVPLATMLATGQLAEADQVRYCDSVCTLRCDSVCSKREVSSRMEGKQEDIE